MSNMELEKMMMMKKQSTRCTSAAAAVGKHKDSQTISKAKPKIRIIHIFAPEIIKTDAANFRELVQRLTGKPTNTEMGNSCKKKQIRNIMAQQEPTRIVKKMELSRSGFLANLETTSCLRSENIINGDISNSISGDGFLNGFADLEYGFIQELGEFPFLPMQLETTHNHMHAANF